jgi:tRNA dimethylallyltransferase
LADVRLPVIVGPTAAGKSAIALAIAQATGATIISADSRQVYRGFDVGTAKPTPNELATVRHVGIDVARPDERYSAARFADLAHEAIREHHEARRPIIVVGGTGFYVKALFEPLFNEPPLDADRREKLGHYLADVDTETLRAWCTVIDPARRALGRTQLLRAIEVALLSGKRLSDLFHDRRQAPPVTPRYLIVDPGPSLQEQIERRLDTMFERGWIDEIRRLMTTIPPTAPAWKATGYDVLRSYVVGEGRHGDLAATRSAIVTATRQYAKRQRTWFRHQLHGDIHMLDPNEGSALERALKWMRGASA